MNFRTFFAFYDLEIVFFPDLGIGLGPKDRFCLGTNCYKLLSIADTTQALLKL